MQYYAAPISENDFSDIDSPPILEYSNMINGGNTNKPVVGDVAVIVGGHTVHSDMGDGSPIKSTQMTLVSTGASSQLSGELNTVRSFFDSTSNSTLDQAVHTGGVVGGWSEVTEYRTFESPPNPIEQTVVSTGGTTTRVGNMALASLAHTSTSNGERDTQIVTCGISMTGAYVALMQRSTISTCTDAVESGDGSQGILSDHGGSTSSGKSDIALHVHQQVIATSVISTGASMVIVEHTPYSLFSNCGASNGVGDVGIMIGGLSNDVAKYAVERYTISTGSFVGGTGSLIKKVLFGGATSNGIDDVAIISGGLADDGSIQQKIISTNDDAIVTGTLVSHATGIAATCNS